ncbi:MAG TPA: acylphosphatase [Armatimonadota bacterium]|jgi:acylphosphatase
MKRLHATVEGRVQGVGYRDYVRTQARNLHLRGWVRNLPNGNVEVMAEGEDVALQHLLLVLEKGPSMSRVDEIETSYGSPTGEFSDFHVRY